MRLFLHQFRKDLRQTWVLWLVWLLFVALQFAMAAWNVNPSDNLNQGAYAQLIGLVPMIHSLLLFVLIPALLLQEPTVGVTASWLTRPMPRTTVLGSKLAALLVLVLVPLIGQCLVLAAHGIVLHDVILAGLQIGLTELSWIAVVTALAALSPNFGWFFIAAAVLFALQYFGGWLLNWVTLLHAKKPLIAGAFDDSTALWQSREVVGDLLRAAIALGIVLFQYLTRRTRLSFACAAVGLLAVFAVGQYWPWDFLKIRTQAATLPFDASTIHIKPTPNHNLYDQPDWRGSSPRKAMDMTFSYSGLATQYQVRVVNQGGELTLPDGGKLPLPADNHEGGSQGAGPGMLQIEAAIGNLPLLGPSGNIDTTFDMGLFAVDAKFFSENAELTGTAVFRVKGDAMHYRIAAEIPLRKGAASIRGSERITLTEVLRNSNGVTLQLDKRTVRLLLKPEAVRAPPPIYVLVNRKREEALTAQTSEQVSRSNFPSSGPMGGLASFARGASSDIEQGSLTHLFFGASQNWQPRYNLPVAIDASWIADAALVILEPVFDGPFETSVTVPDFSLDGNNLPGWSMPSGIQSADPEGALAALSLPENPTRSEVWKYLLQIDLLSRRQQSYADLDIQIDMLKKLGPAHASEMLIAASMLPSSYYEIEALKSFDLTRSGVEEMVLRLLNRNRRLIPVVVKNHWVADAKPILLERVADAKPYEDIEAEWLSALVSLRDPTTYDVLLSYVESRAGDYQRDEYLDYVRAIPGPLVAARVERVWKRMRNTKREPAFMPTAAAWGVRDALDRAAEILGAPVDNDKEALALRNEAGEVMRNATPCPGNLLDADMAAWYAANRDKLAFDPSLGRFLFHAVPPPPDQGWPKPEDYMKALGQRAATGDTGAIDEIEAAIGRLIEKADGKRDEGRIYSLQGLVGNAFNVLSDAAVKNPEVFRVLDYANEKPDLRPFVAGSYSKAAAEGNDEALDALIHYQDRHWTLADALANVAPAIRKNNPKAVDFILGVLADPATKALPDAKGIRAQLIGEVRAAANAGSEKARAVYETLHKQ